MDRQAKEALAKDYREIFTSAAAVVVSGYRGLNVPQLETLRGELVASGGAFRVIRNRIAKRALADTKLAGLADMFEGPTALAWSEDPLTAAKLTARFAKDNTALALRGGTMGERLLTEEEVKELAALPSLEELRAKLVGLVQAPAQKLARLLQTPSGQLARLMTQKPEGAGDKKEEVKAEAKEAAPEAAPAKEAAPEAEPAKEESKDEPKAEPETKS